MSVNPAHAEAGPVNVRLLVIAKEPVPGAVKTRLCPPCTPEQAAQVARAALEDTLGTVARCAAARRTFVVHGDYPAPPGWDVLPQRGDGLAARLANAFADAARFGGDTVPASLLVGMDTPQLTPGVVAALAASLAQADAVIGPAADGGWWGLALRDPGYAEVLRDVEMSTSDTGQLTARALRELGLRVVQGPLLRDVDTASDARVVAAQCPTGSFAAAVRAHVPADDVPGGGPAGPVTAERYA